MCGYSSIRDAGQRCIGKDSYRTENALTKQYQKMLELDGVKLTFDKKALETIAETSLKRKTGARGLRAINGKYHDGCHV